MGHTASHAGDAHTIIVPDAHLLFSGDYKRAGADLVLSKDGHEHVIHDYFKGSTRAALASPDGAQLTGDLVNALTGEVQFAQAGGGAAAAAVIGHVTKLTGIATAIRNGVSIQLNVGDNVNKGDVVEAGGDSSLGLTFVDGTVFGLSSNARMVLNEMVYDPNGSSNSSLLSLVQGTITFVAGETAKHGDMKVDTPVATMGIRGTAVLVEIDFSVPGQGTAPPVKFAVLVEPGGHTGSYVLYAKGSGTQIGSVSQAGQVTSVSGNGDTSTGQAPPLTPLARAIIETTFQQYFPNYVPGTNPQGTSPYGGSTPASPVPGSSNPDPLNFELIPTAPGVPKTIPIKLQGSGGDTTLDIIVTRFNSAPTITVVPVAVTLPVDKTSFAIQDQVKISDPDGGDVVVPYVPGTGHIISAAGPANTPSTINLASLVIVDPATGQVSYNPATFLFLGVGQSAVFTIGFDSQSGPDTIHETLIFTVDGVNDAPVVTAPLTSAAHEGDAAFTANLLAGASDPDAGETATLSLKNVKFAVDGGAASPNAPGGVSLTGSTLHVDPTSAAFIHLAKGQTTTIVVTFDVTDAQGATVTQTETITVTGTNDAPVVSAPLAAPTHQGDAPFTANLLAGAIDPDDGETASLTVTDVHFSIDGGIASSNVPTGVSLTGATLHVDPTNSAFTHLALGQTTTITVTYNVTDVQGAIVAQTETITVTGTNDLPVVGAPLTSSAHQGDAAFTANLLAGATDPDDGESATLSVTGVHYSVDGGAASQTAPAGVSLTGATLHVDPTNAAFAHLAQGQTSTITITYSVTDVHGATTAQTETITVTGTNDTPVVGAPLTSPAHEGDAAFTANLLAGASDPDDGETAALSVTNVHYSVDGGPASQTAPAGFSLTGAALHVDPTDRAFAHLTLGQTTSITVTYGVTDAHGATVPQTETVTLTGTNDAPVVSGPLTASTQQCNDPFSVDLLSGATDPDDGETATLSVTNVHYSVDGGAASLTAPTGISLNGATLNVDPTNPAFAHLAQGQTSNITVTYDVTDIHGATVQQTETVAITGINDPPDITASTPVDLVEATASNPGTPISVSTLTISDVDGPVSYDGAALLEDGWTDNHDGTFCKAGTYGTATLNTADNTLAYVLDNDAADCLTSADHPTETFTVPVIDNLGATCSTDVTFTINGSDDPILPVTTVWTGNGHNDNWNNPANWSPQVPTDIDTASFNGKATVVLDGTIVIAGLILAEGVVVDVTTNDTSHVIDVTGSLSNDGEIVLHAGTTLEVSGVVQNAGTITVDTLHPVGATLLIDGSATLEGAGVVTLDGTTDRIVEHAPGATLTNVDNKIDGYGNIGNGHLTLINDAGGIIAATDSSHGITINTGDGTFTNDGLIVSASLHGGLEIQGNIINNGTLEAHIGTLKVDGNVTGHGDAVIDGGVLEFGGNSNAAVQFTSNTSDELVLDRGSHFTGTVTGFSYGDSIDLAGIASRDVHLHTNADGTTTVDYGTGSFTIAGDYARSGFDITSDHNGGTEIVWDDQAPQIATSNVGLSQHNGTTTISGLSVSDSDAGWNETFTLSTDAHSGVGSAGDSDDLSDINHDFQHGLTFHAGNGPTGIISVTVADHQGATDTVNFIFSTDPQATSPATLTGTAGKDVIFATTHTDTMSGGASADQFVFATAAGTHTITDFTPGQDKIELDFAPSGSHAFQQWLANAAVQQGPDTLLHLDNAGDTLLLKHVSVADLHASDFIVHGGQTGA